MAIRILSHTLSGITDATPNAPSAVGSSMNFTCAAMHCDGTVRFDGLATDARAGWDVGWVQAQWIETNWGYYRGQFDNHGSVFLQRGRPPARPRQGCRDTSGPVGDIFTDPTSALEFQSLPAAGPFPITLSVQSNDPPGEGYPLIVTNAKTNAPNFIQEVQLEFHFVTMLTVRDPAGAFHHQAHFYWNVHWQFRFQPTAFPSPTNAQWTITRVANGTSAHHSGVIQGACSDHRFSGVFTSPQRQSCVDLATAATNSPNRKDFERWESVDVRK